MGTLLAGRLVQGLGGGMLVALAHVSVSRLYEPRLWPRLYAIMSGLWGASALAGPLVGGLFADAGHWRGAFWAFGAQAALVAVAGGLGVPCAAARDREQLQRQQLPMLAALVQVHALVLALEPHPHALVRARPP